MSKLLLTSILALGFAGSPAMAVEAPKAKPPVLEAAPVPFNDDFRYELKYWGSDLLEAIDLGPRILPADMVFDLKPFPANTSAETTAELATLKKFAAEERTPEQVARIQQENALMPLYQIYAQNGLYDFETHPMTNSLLASVDRDVSYFILREKKAIQRPRPSQLAPDLTTVIEVPPHSAYPSGHAGQVYAAALILSEVDPAQAEKYKQLAIDVAHRREIAGVHYPSDSEAGRDVAKKVVKLLLAKPEIQERIALAKKEFGTN